MCAGFVTLHLVQGSLPQLPNRVSLQTIKEEQITLPWSTIERTVVDVCVAAGAWPELLHVARVIRCLRSDQVTFTQISRHSSPPVSSCPAYNVWSYYYYYRSHEIFLSPRKYFFAMLGPQFLITAAALLLAADGLPGIVKIGKVENYFRRTAI